MKLNYTVLIVILFAFDNDCIYGQPPKTIDSRLNVKNNQKTELLSLTTQCYKLFDANWLNAAAIKPDGTLWGWGYNPQGQVGLGTSTALINIQSQTGAESNWAYISTGDHSLAIKKDGTLWAWGENMYGQLGDGTNVRRYSPVQIGTDNDWAMVSSGLFHSLAIKKNGTLWAWGVNTHGCFGNGTGVSSKTPIQIGAANNWKFVVAGDENSFAIKTDGTLWSWGDNLWGRLGTGSTPWRSVVGQIGTDNDWSFIDVSQSHCIAIKNNGSLWTWGRNDQGQLGDGSLINKNTPIQIGIDTDWQTAAAGGGLGFGSDTHGHSLALKKDGTLWAWGNNSSGGIGDGTNGINTYKTTPQKIGTSTDWLYVSAGCEFSMAMKKNGSLWAWGNNSHGELGDGSESSRNTPVQISYCTSYLGCTCTAEDKFLSKPYVMLNNNYVDSVDCNGRLLAKLKCSVKYDFGIAYQLSGYSMKNLCGNDSVVIKDATGVVLKTQLLVNPANTIAYTFIQGGSYNVSFFLKKNGVVCKECRFSLIVDPCILTKTSN